MCLLLDISDTYLQSCISYPPYLVSRHLLSDNLLHNIDCTVQTPQTLNLDRHTSYAPKDDSAAEQNNIRDYGISLWSFILLFYFDYLSVNLSFYMPSLLWAKNL